MNHKQKMHNLENIKRDKLQKMKELQADISKIDAAIRNHKRLYLLNNKYSDQAKEVLAGYSRKNVTDIIQFILGSLMDRTDYNKHYGNSNPVELMNDEDFSNFVIVEIGGPTIKDLMKHFVGVEIHNGEELLRTREGRAPANDNTRNRLWKKLTKKSITEEAKRIHNEKQKDE